MLEQQVKPVLNIPVVSMISPPKRETNSDGKAVLLRETGISEFFVQP